MPFDDQAEFNWLDEEVETPDLFSLLPNEEEKSPEPDIIGVDALEPVMPLLQPIENSDEEIKKVLVDFLPIAPKLKRVDLMFEENKKPPPPP